MSINTFEEIWATIEAHKGETFPTITGLEFPCEVEGGSFYPSRTEYRIPKSDFKTTFQKVPTRL